MAKRIVVALGGNALGANLPEQMEAVKTTSKAIVDLIEEGNEVVVVHGNGPQVGMIANAMAELTRSNPQKYIPCPLSVCGAMSQGYIGYDLQNALREEMLDRNIDKGVATVLTQVEVAADDPAFADPVKPIGPWMSEAEAKELEADRGYQFIHDEKRTNLYAEGDDAGIAALEKELLAQNATHQDWCSTTELMEKTANGQDTIFMHPLPADISGVSCEHGEVNADVFDMHRVGMYREASYKPYAIAAMMFLQKVADPAATLKALDERNTARWFQA